jgi:riboflavin synthase
MGESISVSGACLTVTGISGSMTEFEVLAETADKTTLSHKNTGSILNLERALKAGDRLGGHIVTGHIDGIGRALDIERSGEDHILTVKCGPDIIYGIVSKGSVAIDGISLTVAGCDSGTFSVHIIPTTWTATGMAVMRTGDPVNIETDIIGKYIRKYSGNAAAAVSRFNPALF